MSSTTWITERNVVNSFGIPVDNLTLNEAMDRITEMARMRDGNTRWVATLNVDFLVNALGCGWSRPRHPELLSILRKADLVTADGFPILVISQITGRKLKQRVTGADLLPNFAARARDEGLSMFLLGGAPGSAEAAAKILQDKTSGLQIAGTASPMVKVAGQGVEKWDSDDESTVQHINNSGADILFIGLGNPKQELWFNRNRGRLNVPVAIGVGGTFEFITGKVQRAPSWVQNCNLEWLYRITQDPKRLWRRYAQGLLKLALFSLPLIKARMYDFFFMASEKPESLRITIRKIWSTRDDCITLFNMPAVVTNEHLQELVKTAKNTPASTSLRLLDFSKSKHIMLDAHHHFLQLTELVSDPGKNLKLIGIGKRLKRCLRASRVMDLLDPSCQSGSLSTLASASIDQPELFSCASYVSDKGSLIFMEGVVNSSNLRSVGFGECLQQTARDRTCVLDLRQVTAIESSGIAELYANIESDPHLRANILLAGASYQTRQMFRLADLAWPDNFLSDNDLMDWLAGEPEYVGE